MVSHIYVVLLSPHTHTSHQAHHVLESGVVFLSSSAADVPPPSSPLEPHQRQPRAQEGKVATAREASLIVSSLHNTSTSLPSPSFPFLCQHYVQMKVDLLWDTCFPGVRDPLYLVWLGKGRHHVTVM